MANKKLNEPILHGGDLLTASKVSGIPLQDWVDLSTGISPYAYPSSDIPKQEFSKLPYIDESFNEHAKQYYGSEKFIALPGTQSAIQLIPSLLEKLPILLPSVGYQEHHKAWEISGNQINYYNALDERAAFEEIELTLTKGPMHLLVINPNNPSTLSFNPKQLITWAKKLAKGAYLIVDEAFIDTSPSQSLVPFLTDTQLSNIIVLRSFGKFFGLAGLRLGFVFSAGKTLALLADKISLWAVNGPALYLANKAFSDHSWQFSQQEKLVKSEQITRSLFAKMGCESCYHQRLFSSYILSKELALTIFNIFYNRGILLRLINITEGKYILRIGRLREEDVNAIVKVKLALEELRVITRAE